MTKTEKCGRCNRDFSISPFIEPPMIWLGKHTSGGDLYLELCPKCHEELKKFLKEETNNDKS